MNVPEHQQKAEANRLFAVWLQVERPQSCDWAAIAYFYSALHLVDAYLLAYHGRRPETHEQRKNDILAAGPAFSRDRRTCYFGLLGLGHRARYKDLLVNCLEVDEAVKVYYEPLASWLLSELRKYAARQASHGRQT